MDIRTVGVVGAGTMGSGIARVMVANGLDIVLNDIDEAALKNAVAKVGDGFQRLVSKDAMSAALAIQWIRQRYVKENLEPGELRHLVLTAFHDPERRDDPLRPFSEACKHELKSLARAV